MSRKKKTNEEFIREVYRMVGKEYEFQESYMGAKTKIQCKHNICGKVYNVTPTNFLTGKRCPSCYGTPKKKNSDFVKEVFDLVGDEYVFLDKYVDRKTKITCRHNTCGFEWQIEPGNFLSGRRCPQCSRPNYHRDTKQFKQEVYNLTIDEYVVLGDYINAQTKINIMHTDCGFDWDILPQHFLNGVRCPKCMGVLKKSEEQFNQEVYEFVGDEYVFLEGYINSFTKIKCRHNVCGHEWEITPGNFLSGKGCPQCNESKGEKKIRRYLENKNIRHVREYSFCDLLGVGGMPLRFDFATFNANGKLKLLIEYDGEFHFENRYEDDGSEYIKVHDRRKNQYCKDNGIPLLRIPYWDFDNIESILTKMNALL